MKSYWVSTSQKMTRGMAAVLEWCQRPGISRKVRERVNRMSYACRGFATGGYRRSTTATSSQQFCLGQRAQSAHTLSGNCSRSAGAKPSFKKNAGLRVKGSEERRVGKGWRARWWQGDGR